MPDELMGSARGRTPVQRSLKMILVSPYYLFPQQHGGGQIRTINLARGLAKLGHEVTVLTPRHPQQRPALYREEPFTLRQVPYPFVLPRLFLGRLFPFYYLVSFHPGLRLVIKPMLRDADVVQFEHVSFAGLLRSVSDRAIVGYDAHNVEYDYVRHECHSARVEKIVGRRIHRLESELLRRSDCVFPVSALDQGRMKSLYGLRDEACTLAPNGIPTAREAGSDDHAMLRRFPRLAHFRTRAIFSGSNADHNRRAISFILERVAPVARDAGFVIHGTCSIPFEHRCSLPNVFFDADPECRTFTDYTVTGTIGLNPVETGSGTNLKLLQYLSHGLPVLSTPFGMRGYDDLADYVRVEDRDAFAMALTEGGFPPPPPPALLLERYSWGMIAARVADAYIRRLR